VKIELFIELLYLFRTVSTGFGWVSGRGCGCGRSACMLVLIQGHNLRVGVRTAPIHNL